MKKREPAHLFDLLILSLDVAWNQLNEIRLRIRLMLLLNVLLLPPQRPASATQPHPARALSPKIRRRRSFDFRRSSVVIVATYVDQFLFQFDLYVRFVFLL